MVGVMAYVIKDISGKSGRYFADQQKNLGIENGFIEEMMSGQKVVKAFIHEKKVLKPLSGSMTNSLNLPTKPTAMPMS